VRRIGSSITTGAFQGSLPLPSAVGVAGLPLARSGGAAAAAGSPA